MQESAGDPRVFAGVRTGDAGASKFAAQWNSSRLTNLYKFAGSEKPTLQQQLDFVLEEMNSESPYVDKKAAAAYKSLLGAGTVEEATKIFRDNFERPLDPKDITPRVQYALQAQDLGNYGGAELVAQGPAKAIPEEEEPLPEAVAEEEPSESAPVQIDVPEVQAVAPQEAPQVESEDWTSWGFEGGGAIPEVDYATGGAVDKYNPNRAYTQPIKQAPVSQAARRVSFPARATGAADWRSWGAGGTPSQKRFRTPATPVSEPQPAPAPAAPAASAAPKYSINSQAVTDAMNRGPRGRVPRSSISNFMQAARAGPLSPEQQAWAQEQGFLTQPMGAGAAPWTGSMGFRRGGSVWKNVDTPRSRVSRAEFDEMVRREERPGRSQHGGGDSARDIVAKRIARKERGVTSSAFRSGAEKFPPAPEAPGKAKGGGGKRKPGTAAGATRPLRHPGQTYPGGLTIRRNPYDVERGEKDVIWSSPQHWTPGVKKTIKEQEKEGAPVWSSPEFQKPLDEIIGPAPEVDEDVIWSSPARHGQNPNSATGYAEGGMVTDMQGNPVIMPSEGDAGASGEPEAGLSFARGGAIPEEEDYRPGVSARIRDPGYRPPKRKAKADPWAGMRTKTSRKVKKAKSTGREAGKRKGKKRQYETTPATAPRPTRRPGTAAGPGFGERPENVGAGPSKPIVGRAERVETTERVTPEKTESLTIKNRYPHVKPSNVAYQGERPENVGNAPSYPKKQFGPLDRPGGYFDQAADWLDETFRPKPSGNQPEPPYKPSTGMGGRPPTLMQMLGFQRGGAIPEEDFPNPPAGGDGYASPPAEQDVAATEAGPWGAPMGPAAKPTIKVPFSEAVRNASTGVQEGIAGIQRIFGISAGGGGGIATPEGDAMADQGVQRFASGEGAATGQEVQAIDKTFGIDEVAADEGTKNLIRIDKVVQYWLQAGDKEKAEAAAASLLMHGAKQVQQASIIAATAMQEYQQTGDPQDLRNASLAIQRAHQMIPDGVNLKIDVDPETRQIMATTYDESGKSQTQVIEPGALPALLKQGMDGSAYWKAAFQIGQPRLAEQEMVSARGAGDEESKRRWQLEFDEYKDKREQEQEQERWERDQNFKLWEHERDTGEGRTETEREDAQTQAFYDDWNARLAETEKGSPERQQLLTEGMGYRYQNTQDRREAIPDSELSFFEDTENADLFADDLDAIKNLARVIGRKNDALDGGGAMQMAAALIMAPALDHSPDGTLNVEGYSLVFNPTLLPQLGQLRKKYQQE